MNSNEFKNKLLLNKSFLRDNDLTYQAIVIVPIDGCEICKSEKDKVYNFKDFYNNYKLPHENCSCKKGCRCTFGIQALRDHNGRLIFNNLIHNGTTKKGIFRRILNLIKL